MTVKQWKNQDIKVKQTMQTTEKTCETIKKKQIKKNIKSIDIMKKIIAK